MKRKIICAAVIGIAAAGFLEIFRCSSPLAGNGSQTPNGQVSAMVYNPDGTPAAHAKVMFYPINYNPHTGGLDKTATATTVDSTTTNDSGNYTATLDTGTYNIIANGSGNMAYQDSIRAIGGSAVHPPTDTLKTPGTIRGIVQLQPGDDPETVFILFMGTYTFSMPIDTTGTFTTAAMAAGSYWVRILTSLPNYQVLDTNLTVIAGTQNVLPQPIKLKYTGIPIPTGLSATYDTVHGVVTVRWNKVTFQNLKGYIVYRNDTSTTLPQQISGNSAITDTFYNDTIFRDLLDTSNFVYAYRVKVQDTNANIGDKFSAPCVVTAVSPTKVRTFITLKTLNTISDTASINDSVKIIATYQNQTRKNSKISWYVEKNDSLVKSKGIVSLAGSDTLMNIWRTPGVNKVFVKIQDTAGTVWEDSITVTIVLDAPVAFAGNDTVVATNSQVTLHGSATQEFGTIIKWEWNINNSGFRQTATGDTTITTPDSIISMYPCVLRVTDDDGNIGEDTVILQVGNPWSALGSGTKGGYYGVVFALAVDNSGNLYAGGSFDSVGGIAANNIAKWNGSSWSALGSGTSGWVQALAFDNSGNLYAGGVFSTAGGGTVNGIAKWDGNSWSALGSGTNYNVYALAFDNSGNLYAGGCFSTAGGVTAKCIAKWDGNAWSALGSGMNGGIGVVFALAFDNSGNLYAGGSFTTAGGAAANYIAKWNGTAWSTLSAGMNDLVYALAFDNSGNLYASGDFTTAGGVIVNYIAKWDGNAWSALSSGMNITNVLVLASDRSGNLYAGGEFTTAGSVSANLIAKWDGSSWNALGNGINGGSVNALAFDRSGNLYAGGQFSIAGGAAANNIAKWK
ncbi:MAG: hypothetical protein ABSF80_12445 [Chitinispirillaceae bacterium]|jgi:hypothetical protein